MVHNLSHTASRVCNCCRQQKSTSLFHLKGADKSGQTRYQSICKDCANVRRTARYHNKKTRLKNMMQPDSYAIEIFFHAQDSRPAPVLMDIMNDYIEAVYANQNYISHQSTH